MLIKRTCPECQGDGWIIVPAHGCDGNERLCASICPVPEQEQCEFCRGEGYIEDEIECEDE